MDIDEEHNAYSVYWHLGNMDTDTDLGTENDTCEKNKNKDTEGHGKK